MRPLVYDSTRRIYRVVGEEVGGAWEAGKALMWDGSLWETILLRE